MLKLFLLVSSFLFAEAPAPSPRAPSRDVAEGAAIYATQCARCHEPAIEWTLGGCRPASLVGVGERYEKEQVMNLLDHGVMAMPSFANMGQPQRDKLWAFLSSRPAPDDLGPTPGQFCGRVKAAMAGKPMPGGCGGGGGQGGGGCGKATVNSSMGCGGGGCGGACQGRPTEGQRGAGRRWSFGR